VASLVKWLRWGQPCYSFFTDKADGSKMERRRYTVRNQETLVKRSMRIFSIA